MKAAEPNYDVTNLTVIEQIEGRIPKILSPSSPVFTNCPGGSNMTCTADDLAMVEVRK
jgi:hypothetical protein